MKSKNKRGSGINKKYTHFAVLKSNGKVVNGWEYKGYDAEELNSFKKDYFYNDLKDNDINPKDVRILTKQTLLKRGIDPFVWESWANYKSQSKPVGSTKTAKKETLKKKAKSPMQKRREKNAVKQLKKLGLSGNKYHKVSKPVGGFMQEPNNQKLIEIGSLKPNQRFMFPNGKSTYTFKKFSQCNAAVYESDKGKPYKTQNLKIKVVLVS